jgi:carbamate kinase
MVHMSSAMRRGGGLPTAVVAVGGNALTAAGQAGTWTEIAANAAEMAGCLAELRAAGWRIAVVHGNGPQVGNLAIQQDGSADSVPPQPLHQLCAMTQGQLGSVLVRAVDRLCGAGAAVAVVTHVGVALDDPAFALPTKPIGPFLGAGQAQLLTAERGWEVIEDSGRGYRRVVPSPDPLDVVELAAVRVLLDAGHVVLAAGGGGIAVSAGPDGTLAGVDAVIDKDLAAAALSTAVGARELYLLTGVDNVLLDFGTPDERPAHRLTAEEAQHHLDQGQFPPGSMGPKVTAALRFLRDGGQRAIITSARRLAAAAAGVPGVGTSIVAAPVAAATASTATRS